MDDANEGCIVSVQTVVATYIAEARSSWVQSYNTSDRKTRKIFNTFASNANNMGTQTVPN